MDKHLLTREEIAELLAPAVNDEPLEDSYPPISGQEAAAAEDRGSSHQETLIQYLQETVRELQQEIAGLRNRIDKLENTEKRGGSVAVTDSVNDGADRYGPSNSSQTSIPPAADPTPTVSLSRSERHLKKGRWF